MERLTRRVGSLVGLEERKTLYPNKEQKSAKVQSSIVRLAAYEDTGLTPEEVKALIPSPNVSLTLEELRGMDGEPVYMVDLTGGTLWNQWIIFETSTDYGFIPIGGGWFDADTYGKTWLAYRRRLEEVE